MFSEKGVLGKTVPDTLKLPRNKS